VKCLFYRWGAARALNEGVGPTPGVRAHLAACAACREHDARERAVAAQLWQEASARRAEAPESLHARIAAQVRAEGRPRPALRPVLAPVWLGAAAALALTVGVLWRHGRGPAAPGRSGGDGSAPASAAMAGLAEVVQPLYAVWRPWAAGPLESESAALRDDLAKAGQHVYACLEP
jgi:hypothetical protein